MTEPAPAGGWRTATVAGVRDVGARLVALRLDVPDRVDHWPGQHYVVRLRAPDGYTAQRSYSVASAPSDPLVELCVEHLPDGEVSGHLAEVVEPGDALEVRGPIGGWFTWRGAGPALLVGGGTGVVPLVAMLRHAVHLGRTDLLSVVAAARTRAELPYADELDAAGAVLALSREATRTRPAGRLTAVDLPAPRGTAYVCGTAGFADAATDLLLAAGLSADAVRVERFGETG
ncbi:ferredoxin reductase [Rhodococcus aerolatus]